MLPFRLATLPFQSTFRCRNEKCVLGFGELRRTMIDITRRTFAASVIGALASQAQVPGDLAALTLAEASGQMRAGTVTATQLTEACLARIHVYNPKFTFFITLLPEHALTQARG